MSRLGYLICEKCGIFLCLGKLVLSQEGSDEYFIGSDPSWKSEYRTKAVWKFLAEHSDHLLKIENSYELSDKTANYVEVGGDSSGDIPFSEYVKNNA